MTHVHLDAHPESTDDRYGGYSCDTPDDNDLRTRTHHYTLVQTVQTTIQLHYA